MIIELRSESVVQIGKSSGTEEMPNVPNVPNDDASTSTEVLQIVEQDHEEVKEEPQVLNILFSRHFLFFLAKDILFFFFFFINSSQ